MKKQIDNLFKPRKPVGKKDPDFDNTVEKMQFDDQGKPFNPRNPLKKADGGIMRIGLKEGEGIMQMASVDEPFYRSGDEDEHSFRMFKKPYKELNADELEEFQEEMMRLMNKFSSAPDPMDERNELSIRLFKKPLDLLTPEEMDILNEEAERLMQKFSKTDRGAPSITLADGGRAAFKDGPLKRGIKAITDTDTYKTLEDRGFNTAVTLNYAFDEIFNLLSGIPFADGGRAAFKDGPKDPRRRTFMKAAAGIASLIPGLGMIGKGAKVAAPVVAKAAEISGPALSKLVETVMSTGKLISLTGKRVKEMVTKKKLGKVEVTEDIQDGSYIIKKDGKEIYYKPGRQDEMGIDDDIIEVIEKRIQKAGGGGIGYMLGE
jgi:polyhydroxyalkanoate synthesis regulator phasin